MFIIVVKSLSDSVTDVVVSRKKNIKNFRHVYTITCFKKNLRIERAAEVAKSMALIGVKKSRDKVYLFDFCEYVSSSLKMIFDRFQIQF